MSTRIPKMMIGFVVRRCAVELGRMPTPAEFAAWANSDCEERAHRFGRPISEEEARLILRHQARLVTARSATSAEAWVEPDELAPPSGANVIRLADVRARRARN
ncbi:MAG: hypothetical protein ABI629_25435 [bacterium]